MQAAQSRPFGRLPPRPSVAPMVPAANPPKTPAVSTPPRRTMFSQMGTVGSAAGAKAPAPTPREDMFALPGFIRLDTSDCPALLTPSLWDDVFPPDRETAWRLAGRLFLKGIKPDAALLQAVSQIERDTWRSGPLAVTAEALLPAFPEHLQGRQLLAPPVAAATLAVANTANRAWREIIAAENPVRTAFLHRTWSAPKGCCLVCGDKADGTAQTFPSKGRPASPDAIHTDCRQAMMAIGPAFGMLVVEKSRKIAALHVEPTPPEVAELPDLDTWSSFAMG